jgi:hypothetical protein
VERLRGVDSGRRWRSLIVNGSGRWWLGLGHGGVRRRQNGVVEEERIEEE